MGLQMHGSHGRCGHACWERGAREVSSMRSDKNMHKIFWYRFIKLWNGIVELQTCCMQFLFDGCDLSIWISMIENCSNNGTYVRTLALQCIVVELNFVMIAKVGKWIGRKKTLYMLYWQLEFFLHVRWLANVEKTF